jgi:predicted metal-binding protein
MFEEAGWRVRSEGQDASGQGASEASRVEERSQGRQSAAGIVEVKCLGVCPRGAVTVVNGAASREWLLVPEGADLDAVAGELGLDQA